jgi:hypothetical protein
MARLILLLTTILGVAGAMLSLQSCEGPAAEAAAPASRNQKLTALPDGSTMIARAGSPERRIADWVNADDGSELTLELARDSFEPSAAKLSPVGLGRVTKIAGILRAAPDAKVTLTASDTLPLSDQRSRELGRFLLGRGLLKTQIAYARTPHDGDTRYDGVEMSIKRTASAQ